MESSRLDYGQFTQDKTIPQFISCNLFSLYLTAFMLPGVLLALAVLAFLYRRSRLKAAAASGEDSGKQCKGMHHKAIARSEGEIFTNHTRPGEAKEQKGASINAKRPEPEGREEPRPGSGSGGRVWKKPLGVKPQQGKVSQLFIRKVCD